jgi:hypothetical protein
LSAGEGGGQGNAGLLVPDNGNKASIATFKSETEDAASTMPHNLKRWSHGVTKHSDALDLNQSLFTGTDPKRIARALKQSAEKNHRRKVNPFRRGQRNPGSGEGRVAQGLRTPPR